jgi:hypothetical protein
VYIDVSFATGGVSAASHICVNKCRRFDGSVEFAREYAARRNVIRMLHRLSNHRCLEPSETCERNVGPPGEAVLFVPEGLSVARKQELKLPLYRDFVEHAYIYYRTTKYLEELRTCLDDT